MILINSYHFLMFFFGCVLSLSDTYREHVLAIDLQFLSFKFSDVFVPSETLILGCYFVIFWPELPKISILLEILTNDDMQNGASNLLQFLSKYKEIVRTRSKSWFFESFWEGFFCIFPLTPYELHPNILANERPS